MRKIRKGDQVVVLTGKDKGRRGSVVRMVGADKVIVENINVAKKHQRPNPNLGVPGGIVNKEMPIHISNVAIYNPATDKADRVGFKMVDDKKVRVFKSNQENVDA